MKLQHWRCCLDQANNGKWATSPISCTQEESDEDRQAAEELEQTYAAQLKESPLEVDREHRARLYIEQDNLLFRQQVKILDSGNQSDKQDVSRRNLELMLIVIDYIEGDVFSQAHI